MKSLCALAVLRLATAAIVATTEPFMLEAVPLVTSGTSSEPPPVVKKASRELLKSLGYVADEEDVGQSTEDFNETTTALTPTKLFRRHGFIRSSNNLENRTKLYPVGSLWEWATITQRRLDESTGRKVSNLERMDTPATSESPQRTAVSAEETFQERIGAEAAEGTGTTEVATAERTMPPRPMGMMALLDAAFSCLWSGLGFECFSLKVVPMFRAMMGFPPVHPFGHPYYALPRTTDVDLAESDKEEEEDDDDDDDDQNEDENVNATGRRRRRRHFALRMVKMGLMGLAALKTFLLPALSVLSIASGKAIVFSLAAVVLTLAAGWSAAKSAERRVYDTHEPHPYYM